MLGRLDGSDSKLEQAFIKNTIRDRFWQGGGSYVGFYDSLMARNKLLKLTPLEVEKIRYSSPGEIALRGDAAKTLAFAKELRLESVDNILAACEHNTLIFAKVVLSIFRRANELYKFHAEGRVQRAG